MLDLAVAELCREIEVTRRKLPRVPELEQEVVLLQTQLEEERALADRLSSELEAPENSKRWRKLEGKDPEPEDLGAKLQVPGTGSSRRIPFRRARSSFAACASLNLIRSSRSVFRTKRSSFWRRTSCWRRFLISPIGCARKLLRAGKKLLSLPSA